MQYKKINKEGYTLHLIDTDFYIKNTIKKKYHVQLC